MGGGGAKNITSHYPLNMIDFGEKSFFFFFFFTFFFFGFCVGVDKIYQEVLPLELDEFGKKKVFFFFFFLGHPTWWGGGWGVGGKKKFRILKI